MVEREARRSTNDPAPLPIHVVIVDGVDAIASSDLSEILIHGPANGVVGIVADPTVAPDGTMGTLRLGLSADEASFESRLEPMIDRVLTAEMPSHWAESGSRRLAALQPASLGRSELSAVSERLAKTLNASTSDAASLVARWRSTGPVSRVPVGTASDSVFNIDIVRDGPHGLVGGMTRSGKTEFLKTFITSLAWANHPDDLNFVIVDFKGGIDYTIARRLPHVLDLSSNQDLTGFERTLQLLTAEQRRRQTIFESVEVSNLDAYRLARADDPRLPPIPRLIVLIDEFGELMSSDEGREQLRRIESMSRIGGGLGVNLLLITQNFEGQLPPQIAANAGLRVCFRVQEPANSKVVIDSSIATTISAAAQGRAYARLQGSDPLEFQSARVAGRRPELKGKETAVSIRLQPFEMLPHAFKDGEAKDVPADETDMASMIATITAAAHHSGWTTPAIPWPTVLPPDLALASVLPASKPDEVPIGRADVPDQQRQTNFSLRWADDHVALLGGPRADLNTLLVTMACSAAVSHSPNDLHMYAIDFSGRGLARIAQLPHCGGVASRNDALGVRIGRYLLDEVAMRRSELALEGVATLDEYQQRTGRSFPHILLFIAGAEKLSSIATSDEQSPAAVPLTSLLAEGSGLGVQVIAAGLPSFGLHRPGAYIERRIVFEAADVGDYLALGCPRSLLGDLRGPRRAVDIASQHVVQFCSLAGGEVNEADALDALIQRLHEIASDATLQRPPRTVAEVTWPVRLASMQGHLRSVPPRLKLPLLVGIDNQSGEPVWIDAAEFGGSMFIAGARKTGRSNALLTIGLLARHLGWTVIGATNSPSSPLHGDDCPFDVADLASIDRLLARSRTPTMVMIDDLQRLEGETALPTSLGAAQLVVATGPTQVFSGPQRILSNMEARPAKGGIMLMPDGFVDAELVGAKDDGSRIGTAQGRRPGQGLLGIAGELSDITVPLYE